MVTKYYSRLKRPNNEYNENGKLIYESQLNKTFNLFLFTMCPALTLTDKQTCYVEITLDVNGETRVIDKITFTAKSIAGEGVKTIFQKTIEHYYNFSFDTEFSVDKAVTFIMKIAPTITKYISSVPNGKGRTFSDTFYLLHTSSSSNGELEIERGNESPIIRITQDKEKREIIEIGTNYEGYEPYMKCYLDDFMEIVKRISPTVSHHYKLQDLRK